MTDDIRPDAGATALAADKEIRDQIVDLDAEQAPSPAAEVTEEVKPETTEADKADDPPKGEDEAEVSTDDDESDEPAAPKKRSGVSRLKAQLAAQQAEIEALRKIAPKQDDATALQGLLDQEIGPAPKEADFTDYLEYQNAKIAYETEKRIVTRELKQKGAQAAESERLANEEISETFREKVIDARTRIKDFDEVVGKATMSPQHPEIVKLILQSEKSPEIAYHLSKNPTLVQRLNEMQPFMAAREIGKLEVSLSSATPKTVTKAPTPVEPLKGGATSQAQKDPDKMDFEQYAAWRKSGGGK